MFLFCLPFPKCLQIPHSYHDVSIFQSFLASNLPSSILVTELKAPCVTPIFYSFIWGEWFQHGDKGRHYQTVAHTCIVTIKAQIRLKVGHQPSGCLATKYKAMWISLKCLITQKNTRILTKPFNVTQNGHFVRGIQ